MKRYAVNILVIVGVLLMWLPLDASPASACSCAVLPSTDQKVQRSDAVFSGQVIQAGEPRGESSASLVPYEIKVDSVWKGKVQQQTTLQSAESSASCGYEFQTGQTYLIYASNVNGHWKSGVCDGTMAANDTQYTNEIQQLGTPIPIEPGGDRDMSGNGSQDRSLLTSFGVSGLWIAGSLVVIAGVVSWRIRKKRRHSS